MPNDFNAIRRIFALLSNNHNRLRCGSTQTTNPCARLDCRHVKGLKFESNDTTSRTAPSTGASYGNIRIHINTSSR